MGKKQSIESTNKKREKMIGKSKHTNESKKTIGDKNRHPKSKEFKEKLKKPKTPEHKQNISKAKKGILRPGILQAVLQYDLQDNFIKEYLCASDAAESLGKKRNRCGDIQTVCNNNQKTAFKFKWKYKNK